MHLILTADYEEMSQVAALELSKHIIKGLDQRVNVAVTAGKTPKRMYEILQQTLPPLDGYHTHFYNFDEIPVIDQEGITMASLRKTFFEPNNISANLIEVYDEYNYENFDEKINEDGGLDVVMLGLGEDGHFCGILPGSFDSFNQGSLKVSINRTDYLAERLHTIVGGKERTPGYYVTYGPRTIMNARELILIVDGERKAQILKKVIEGPLTKEIPSSIFQLHPHLTVITDQAAASQLSSELLAKLSASPDKKVRI